MNTNPNLRTRTVVSSAVTKRFKKLEEKISELEEKINENENNISTLSSETSSNFSNVSDALDNVNTKIDNNTSLITNYKSEQEEVSQSAIKKATQVMEAPLGRFDELSINSFETKMTNINSENVNSDNANIGNLEVSTENVNTSNINNLKATNAVISNATIENVDIKNLDISKIGNAVVGSNKKLMKLFDFDTCIRFVNNSEYNNYPSIYSVEGIESPFIPHNAKYIYDYGEYVKFADVLPPHIGYRFGTLKQEQENIAFINNIEWLKIPSSKYEENIGNVNINEIEDDEEYYANLTIRDINKFCGFSFNYEGELYKSSVQENSIYYVLKGINLYDYEWAVRFITSEPNKIVSFPISLNLNNFTIYYEDSSDETEVPISDFYYYIPITNIEKSDSSVDLASKDYNDNTVNALSEYCLGLDKKSLFPIKTLRKSITLGDSDNSVEIDEIKGSFIFSVKSDYYYVISNSSSNSVKSKIAFYSKDSNNALSPLYNKTMTIEVLYI